MYDARRRRIGTFIEPVGDGSEFAIRLDGVFVWRRRVIPAAMVTTVLPDYGGRGAVLLNVDDKTLEYTSESRDPDSPSAETERVADEEEVTARLAPYLAAPDSDEDLMPSVAALNEEFGESYLLFVPTPQGYQLVEQRGATPAVHDDVSLPGIDDALCVIKVAGSPLPDDRRPCAYLEPR